MKGIQLFIIFTFLISMVLAHMQMKKPLARQSKFNPAVPASQIDHSLNSPLGSSSPFPCRGTTKGPSVATYRAGEAIKVELFGQATHSGGHCQFSVSYDKGETFLVLKTIMNSCMVNGLEFEVPIPANAPTSSNVVFAWSWVNKVGNREYYMNCADITIEGKQKDGSIVGPKLLVANLPGFPSIPEFSSGYDGSDLFEKRPIITIKGPESVPQEQKPVSNSTVARIASASANASLSPSSAPSIIILLLPYLVRGLILTQ